MARTEVPRCEFLLQRHFDCVLGGYPFSNDLVDERCDRNRAFEKAFPRQEGREDMMWWEADEWLGRDLSFVSAVSVSFVCGCAVCNPLSYRDASRQVML